MSPFSFPRFTPRVRLYCLPFPNGKPREQNSTTNRQGPRLSVRATPASCLSTSILEQLATNGSLFASSGSGNLASVPIDGMKPMTNGTGPKDEMKAWKMIMAMAVLAATGLGYGQQPPAQSGRTDVWRHAWEALLPLSLFTVAVKTKPECRGGQNRNGERWGKREK